MKEEKLEEQTKDSSSEKKSVKDKKEEVKSKVKSKKKFSLDDYKKKTQLAPIEYKPDTWIPMSRAFMETSQLPGIPEGRITMVYGHSDVGKSTAAIELIKNAQDIGKLPILINTEKKFNWEHARLIGVKEEDMIYVDSLETAEDVCQYIKDRLKDQKTGELPTDIVLIWDSVGNVISNAELKADEKGDSSAMMATAKLLNQQIHRIIEKRISDTRKANHPYNATLFVVNHAYQGTMANTLIPYGGNGIMKAATIVLRMGGILSNSTKCYAVKSGINVSYAIKSAFVVEKNHITNIAVKGKIICTPHGFIMDSTKALDEYKKRYREDWELKFDNDWETYDGE
jgi:RecA/RadA recombinase